MGHERSLRAGTARVEITPSAAQIAEGIALTGYVAREGPATGVHDPLYARALVLEVGAQRAVLVTCDLLALSGETVVAAREAIAAASTVDAAGTEVDAVMVACTHTHSGPATLTLRGCGEVAADYVAGLPVKMAAAARAAAEALRPVRLGVGQGALPEGLRNRREDGAPVDPTVGVAWLVDDADETVAVLVNYGCHPVALEATNLEISADYPGVLTATLREAVGGTVFFLTGAGGNVDPVRRGGFDAARWLGEALATVAQEAIAAGEAVPVTSLKVARTPVTFPLQAAPDAATLAAVESEYRAQVAAAQTADGVQLRVARAMVGWAETTLAQLEAGTAMTSVDAEVQLIALGPLQLVGVPGELFARLGMAIKAGVPGQTLIVGYANRIVGYVGDRAAYATGGYEIAEAYKYYGLPAPLAPEAGERVVTAARRLLQAAGAGSAKEAAMDPTTLIKRRDEMRREPLPECHGGEGTLDWTTVLDGADVVGRRLNFIHDDIIPPGASIGVHRHEDDEEYYYIVDGHGVMTLDGRRYEVGPGDITAVYPGGSHGLENRSDAQMRIIVVSVA